MEWEHALWWAGLVGLYRQSARATARQPADGAQTPVAQRNAIAATTGSGCAATAAAVKEDNNGDTR
jgi:hypothetical protein